MAVTGSRDEGALRWRIHRRIDRRLRWLHGEKRHRGWQLPRAAWTFTLCALLGTAACAPKQRIPLDVSPIATSIYLDGEQLETLPRELKLRSDRDHTLFFKSEGHRPELIVLRSGLEDGEPRLEPPSVHLRLAPLDPVRRELRIEEATEPATPSATQTATPPDRRDRSVSSPSPHPSAASQGRTADE